MTLATSPVNPPIIENIPEKLTERPQWVLWHYEERDGKLTKVPYTPAGWRASATDLLDWTPCAEALAAYQRGHYDGIGFVFSSADPFVGIDLDKCRNPETGEISEWAQKIISRVQEGFAVWSWRPCDRRGYCSQRGDEEEGSCE
jgi:putative DNA primase/helicase